MKIVVLCGGTSTERDVSLVTGREVCKALRSKGHKAVLIDVFIGHEGINTKEYLDEDFDNIEGYNPNLLKIVNYYKDKEPINPHAINPDYLKLTEAEESKLN